jgi:hypothetical protein
MMVFLNLSPQSGEFGSDRMSRGVQSFRQSEVQRALRAAKAAGLAVERVKISRDGIEIEIAKPGTEVTPEGNSNPWDGVA